MEVRGKVTIVPAVAEIGPYKLFFYSAEGKEPPHVHIRRGRATAKFWLNPLRLSRSRHMSDHELGTLRNLVEERQQEILEAWNEHFAN